MAAWAVRGPVPSSAMSTAEPPPPEDPILPEEGATGGTLVDFDLLRHRVGATLAPIAGLSLLGMVVDGAIRGLTFALMGRWVGIFVLVSVFGIAVMTALHALGGAGRAEERGERLSSPDVGLAPRRTEVSLVSHMRRDPSADPAEADADGDDASS